MTPPANPLQPFTADELFVLYPKLAARITDLRAILQNPSAIPQASRDAWREDMRSVLSDFMTLMDATAVFIRSCPLEPPHHD